MPAAAAAEGISVLPIPTPFAVGRVNCYLIDDDPLTLVDAGPNSGTSLHLLERLLRERGRRIEDLERIVLTHQHIDHIGLAGILAERSGAEVVALRALVPWLADYTRSMHDDDVFAEEVMRRHGIPADVGTALRAVTAGFRAWGAAVEVTHPIEEGDELVFAGRTWTVHHRPGHSPSDTVFHDAERRLLLGGDHLIGHISSNPLISRPLGGGTLDDRTRSLVQYMDSMARTREMDLDVVLPGHGDPVTEHVALIDERFRMHERRIRKIHAMLADGPRSAHELAQEMWGTVALTQAYLTLSEVVGHVDLLVRDGLVVEDEGEDGVIRFRAVA